MNFTTANITTLIIGAALALTIFYMVRKNHLHGPFAIWWLSVASYPPTLLLVLAVSIILLKMLGLDLQRTMQEKKIRRLTQKIAILEKALKDKKLIDKDS